MLVQSCVVMGLAAGAAATPLLRRNGNISTNQTVTTSSYANCKSFYAPIFAASNNTNLTSVLGPPPANQQVLVQASIDQLESGSTVMEQIANAPIIEVSGSYQLYFEYCTPQSGNPKAVFQTIHGLVGNAAYWNAQIDGTFQNSFAEAAAAAGYATLSYDRLGVGKSDKPDGTNIVQISYEAAQAVAISRALRAGNLSDIPSFSTVIGVGHSYGSNLLTGVASIAPTAFDAIVLTGFSGNSTTGPLGVAGFDSTIANVAYPERFADDANDYVITPSVSADQMEFFHYPNYTQAALTQFTNTKGEYTLGQMNSIAPTLTLPRQDYTHPVLVVTGANDAPYCAADCYSTSLSDGETQLDTARPLFPSVPRENFTTFVVPATGHGINYHTTAPIAYSEIMSFAQALVF